MGPVTMPVPRFGVATPLLGSTGSGEAIAMYAGESVRFIRCVEPAARPLGPGWAICSHVMAAG